MTELEGSFQTVGFLNEGASAIVLWSDAAQGGAAFWPRTVTQTPVTLRATTSGFEDDETGSTWTVDGVAVSGPLAGERLAAIDEAYTAYWRAWAAFNPDTRIWPSAQRVGSNPVAANRPREPQAAARPGRRTDPRGASGSPPLLAVPVKES